MQQKKQALDARVAITTHGNVGEVVDLQDRGTVCLYKCEPLLNGLRLRLIIDIAVGGIGIREEVPVTESQRVNKNRSSD